MWNLLLIFSFFSVLGQGPSEVEALLNEAKEKVYSQPDETIKIGNYILNNTRSSQEDSTHTLYLIAKAYYIKGDYEKTLQHAFAAISFLNNETPNELTLSVYYLTIEQFRNLNLPILAQYYSETLETLEKEVTLKTDLQWNESKRVEDIGKAYLQLEEVDDAIEYFKQGIIPASAPKNEKYNLQNLKLNLQLTDAYLSKNEIDSAAKHLKKCDELLRLFAFNPYYEAITGLEKGELLFNQKKHTEAINALKKADSLAQLLENLPLRNKILDKLTLNYLAINKTQLFLENKVKANQISNSLQVNEAKALNTVYNLFNEEQKKAVGLIEKEKSKVTYVLAGILFLLIILTIFLRYWYLARIKYYKNVVRFIKISTKKPSKNKRRNISEKRLNIPEETEQTLLKKLNAFENSTKFTQQDMSLAMLASQLDTNTKYLSDIINRYKGKHFNPYINELRINYIIQKLHNDRTYLNYKVSYLAQESGFSSHSSFATVFKSVTGLSPAKFIRLVEDKKRLSAE